MVKRNRSAAAKRSSARGALWHRPRLEALEDRITPSTLHWLGNSAAGGNLWNAPGNWQENQVPVSGDTLVFDTTTPGFSPSANGFNPNNNLVGLSNLAIALNDASSAGDFSLSGNAIALAAAGVVSSVTAGAGATQSMNAAMPSTTTFAVTGAPLTIAGNLTGAGGLTVAGSGTLVLQGANTYAGATLVSGGTLRVAQPFSTVKPVARYGFDGNTNNDASVPGLPGLHGTIIAAGTSYVPGRFGQALNFTGSQWVRVPYNAAFGLNTYTVSAWVNLNATPGFFGVVSTLNNSDFTYGLNVQATTVFARVGTGTDYPTPYEYINQSASPGSWHMITHVVDNTAQLATLYYDGVPRNSYVLAGAPLFMKSGQFLTIGADVQTLRMNGAIDEVSIYGKALTASEIAALYSTNTIPTSIPSDSTVTAAIGATLDLADNSVTIGSLAGQGTVTNSASGLATLTVGANNTSSEFSGAIQDGVGKVGVVKIGSGTQTLSGANTYSGPTSTSAGVLSHSARVLSEDHATFQVGRPNSFSVLTGGFPAPTVGVTGVLPAGVTVSPAGVLSGTPANNSAGTFPLTITASNGVGAPVSQTFTLTVVALASAITSTNTATFTENQASTFPIVALGAPNPTISVTGILPAGVSLTPSGVLSGTPAAGSMGIYPLTVRADNGIGQPFEQPFSLIIGRPPTITSANTATFTAGQLGSFSVLATGFPAPTFTASGTLPIGVALSESGVLSGAPATGTGGAYVFTVSASNGTAATATQTFTLTVNEGPTITSADRFTFFAGRPGSFTFTAKGTPAPTISVTGSLPDGVTFAGGVLSGVPTGPFNIYPLTITASNGVGSGATQTFVLIVKDVAEFTSPDTATFAIGALAFFTFTASGVAAPKFSVSGPLPAGVSFSSIVGNLSGTPAAGTIGNYPITVTVLSGSVSVATQNFTLKVIGSLFSSTTYAIPSGPAHLATADFRGIGRADLAVVESGTAAVSYLANDGTGAFTISSFLATPGNIGIAAGDFDKDGYSDLGVANYVNGTVQIFIGRGDGAFSPGQLLLTGLNPATAVTADINKDGNLDFISADSGSTVSSLFLGNGDGTFKPRLDIPCKSAASIDVADFFGDGNPSIAAVSFDSGVVTIVRGNGDGTFRSPITYDLGGYMICVKAGDTNGDGRPDLAIAAFSPSFLRTMINHGDGVFVSGDSNAVVQPRSIAMADFNGDAALDIVVTHPPNGRNFVSVLLNEGAGGFKTALRVPVAEGTFGIVSADFNGDGKPDLAVTNISDNSITILLNTSVWPPITPTATTLTANPNATTGGTLVTFTATIAPSPGTVGYVAFKDNGFNLTGAAAVPVVNGVATFTTSALAAGSHSIRADYSGAFGVGASLSNSVAIVVTSASTATTLTAVTPNPALSTQPIVVSVSVAGGTPTNGETVTLIDAGNGNAPVAASGGFLIDGATTLMIAAGILPAGTHSLVARYAGNHFNAASQSAPVALVVTVAPRVVSVTPNGNVPSLAGAQRTRIVSLAVAFDQAVQFDTGAITLALHTNVTFGGILQSTGLGSVPTTLQFATTDYITWTVSFAGNTEDGADSLNSLKDGVYDLKIDAARVHAFGLPGATMAANHTTTFHRLFGDTGAPTTPAGGTPNVDFEAVVNSGDNLTFRGAFNNAANYKAYFDFNGDGVINSGDNLQFRSRFNKSVTWRA